MTSLIEMVPVSGSFDRTRVKEGRVFSLFAMVATVEKINAVGDILKNDKCPLKERFRALFTLKNIGGNVAIDNIVGAFGDSSALLKHELAYCLGQMQNTYAIPYLIGILEDKTQEPMVRHEAGEALGAIGSEEVLDILKKYSNDSVVEVAETCTLAVERINWLQNNKLETCSIYASIDPAPPDNETDIKELKRKLLDVSLPLFHRYKAMFALRNLGTEEAIHALGEGLGCESSALFRHEVAFVFGQMQNELSVPYLIERLQSKSENEMVRHECAETLGSIATPSCTEILQRYLHDEERVVRESCEVALDITDYENSRNFQYANTLQTIDQ